MTAITFAAIPNELGYDGCLARFDRFNIMLLGQKGCNCSRLGYLLAGRRAQITRMAIISLLYLA